MVVEKSLEVKISPAEVKLEVPVEDGFKVKINYIKL